MKIKMLNSKKTTYTLSRKIPLASEFNCLAKNTNTKLNRTNFIHQCFQTHLNYKK